jgi:sulfopyruvate decarboxylase subunit beta
MKRIEALDIIADTYADLPLVVTCGATSREMASLGQSDNHLYLLDSMGAAGAVGLGLALAGRGPLASIEGDGSLLMGLSVLSSIAYLRPQLVLIVLDNHEHASADSFPTQAATVSLAALCRGAGIRTFESSARNEMTGHLQIALAESVRNPSAVVITIDSGNEPQVPLLLKDPVSIKDSFVRSLGKRP